MESNQFQLDWLYFEEQLQSTLDFPLPLPEPSLEPFPPSALVGYSDLPPLLPPPFDHHDHDNNHIITNGLDHDLLAAADNLNWFVPLLSNEPNHHQAILTNTNHNNDNNHNHFMVTNNNNHCTNVDGQFCGTHMMNEPNTSLMTMMVDLPDVHGNMIFANEASDALANIGVGMGSMILKEEDIDHEVVGVNLHSAAAGVVVVDEHDHEGGLMRTNGGIYGPNGDNNGENINGGGKKTKVESLEYEEIAKYFEMPISKAAKKLNVGLTVLKKRCRELEIKRWPHRKLQSLRSLIRNVKELGLLEEVERLEEHRRMVKKLPQMELTERTKKLRQACFKANYKRRRTLAPFF
ncbi:hypothetical protein Ancab_009067 [Ancistrocladus abbreviatus]